MTIHIDITYLDDCKMNSAEQIIIKRLVDGDEKAYRYLFDHHYAVLCHIAAQYVHDDFLAETIVSDVILHLWEKRESLTITTSLRSYLAQSVRHRCLDWAKSQSVQREIPASSQRLHDFPFMDYLQDDDYPLGRLLGKELEEEIMQAIDKLPATCGKVFRLSRFEGNSNEAIAKELGISVNTVKYHMKHALSTLRQQLARYLVAMVLLEMTNW